MHMDIGEKVVFNIISRIYRQGKRKGKEQQMDYAAPILKYLSDREKETRDWKPCPDQPAPAKHKEFRISVVKTEKKKMFGPCHKEATAYIHKGKKKIAVGPVERDSWGEVGTWLLTNVNAKLKTMKLGHVSSIPL